MPTICYSRPERDVRVLIRKDNTGGQSKWIFTTGFGPEPDLIKLV